MGAGMSIKSHETIETDIGATGADPNEIEPELRNFFAYWFAGFTQGIEALATTAQEQILGACGKACAHSYTVGIFQKTYHHSGDLDTFLYNLSQQMPAGSYERLSAIHIKVSYDACGCDLVRLGLVTSPTLCGCSAANLRENIEQALGAPVTVAIESSILRGDTQCVFTVALAGAR